MSIWCKIFGHKLKDWFVNVFEPSPCVRTGCDYIQPGIEVPPCPPMPKYQTDFEKAQNILDRARAVPFGLIHGLTSLIILTDKEAVELNRITTFSYSEIRELFGRKI